MTKTVQTGDQFTNGKEVLTVLRVLESGRFYYQMNWQDKPSKYATGLNWVLKNYPTKVEADEYDLGEWVPTGETLDEVIARDLACKR